MLLSWVSKYDGRGTAAARKDFARLGKSAMSTQLTVGALTYAFGRLAQASIKAAMAEQQSLTQVNKALENAGFANATTQVDDFIVSLQNATGIVKKELRPAFVTLFNATGDVGASQEALRKALDISAGTSKDLNTVVTALSRAYSGNRESLNELNTGLDKTLLKTGSLIEIMAELDRKFSGQAAAASATLTGQFLQLQLGIDKVTEAFGKGFIQQLQISQVDVSKFADAMYNLGQFLGMVTNKVVNLTGSLTNLKQWFIDFARGPLGMTKWLQKSVVDPIGTLKDSISSMPAMATGGSALETYLRRIQKIQDAAAAKAAAASRRDLARKKKEAELQKATQDLAKQFDIERISIAAALARQQDASTQARLQALMKLNDLQYSELDTLKEMDDELEKLKEIQDKLTLSQMSSAQAVARIYEQYKLTADEAQRLANIYSTSMVANQAPTAAAFRAAESLASGGIALSGGPITAGSGAATIPTTTTPTVAPVTVNINALSTMDIEEAVAAAVNSGSRAGLAYTQVFSRL